MKTRLVCVHCGKKAKRGRECCKSCGKPILRDVANRFLLLEVLSVDQEFVSYLSLDRAEHTFKFVRVFRPGATASARERMAAEARLLRQLNGAAPFPDFVTAGRLHSIGAVYCAYEFVEGKPLSHVARKMRPSEIIDLFLQTLDTVCPLHNEGWVHCNLYPGHFIVNENGEVRLVSFRSVRKSGSPSHGLGTPGYRPPEQFGKTAAVTPATDVFALGCILYELLTHRPPFPKNTDEPALMARHRFEPPSLVNPALTGDVDAVVARALAFKPEGRYADAAVMGEALRRRLGATTEVDTTVLDESRGGLWQRVVLGFGFLRRALE